MIDGVLIYDDQCGLCTRLASWYRKRAHVGVSVVGSHTLCDQELQELRLTRDDVLKSVWWVDHHDEYPAHRAIARALCHARLPWSLLGVVLEEPLIWPVSSRAYKTVAALRSRIPGGCAG